MGFRPNEPRNHILRDYLRTGKLLTLRTIVLRADIRPTLFSKTCFNSHEGKGKPASCHDHQDQINKDDSGLTIKNIVRTALPTEWRVVKPVIAIASGLNVLRKDGQTFSCPKSDVFFVHYRWMGNRRR